METVVKGIKVACDADISEDEARAYVDYLEEKLARQGRVLDSLAIHIDGGMPSSAMSVPWPRSSNAFVA